MYQRTSLELIRIRIERSCHIYIRKNIYHLGALFHPSLYFIVLHVLHESLTLETQTLQGAERYSGFTNVSGAKTTEEAGSGSAWITKWQKLLLLVTLFYTVSGCCNGLHAFSAIRKT